MVLPGGRTATYAYNSNGQLQTLTDWSGAAQNISYDVDGKPSSVARPGGLTSSYGYDGAGRLNAISHNGPGGNLLNFNYTLDQRRWSAELRPRRRRNGADRPGQQPQPASKANPKK